MLRSLVALLLGAALIAGVSPARAADPIVAQFWYSFGGKNREVTEAHIKKFNESQSKYRIEGTFQGDYFQALAKIRAAAVTKTAPAAFHVVGEALPSLWQAGMLENIEPYARGANGVDLERLRARADPGRLLRLPRQAAAAALRGAVLPRARRSSTTTPTCSPPRA